MIHSDTFRARYAETDAQGVVNNATYLSYFEIGRVEWLRAAGFSYKEIEAKGHAFVVAEARLFYRKPAFFDDELTLRTELAEIGRSSMHFEYSISRDEEEICTGYTRHACVELASGRTVCVPVELAGFVESSNALQASRTGER